MCIAILNKRNGGTLSPTTIYNSWENNDMGAGLLWNSEGKLNLFKTYDYDEFYDKYMQLRQDEAVDNIVLHFRISTSGYKGIHNLHPFMVNANLGFVHNGVISGLGNQDYSDTYQFNDILKGFNHDFVSCQTTKAFIEEYIGHSKLVFLRSNGEYDIFNEDLGHWKDDNWYSNDSYKAVNSWVYAGTKKVSKTMPMYAKETYSSLLNVDVFTDFEKDMYIEICEHWGLDPLEEATIEEMEMIMEEYNCVDIYALYDAFLGSGYDDYNSSYDAYVERWNEFDI